MENAKESASLVPICHSTNPLGIEREAEPEPRLANLDNSLSLKFNPAALLADNANAANAAADEAIPAPAGKLFSLVTWAFSLIFAIWRTISKI